MGWAPTTLIVGPGGVKGFLEIGALQALEVFLVLKSIRRIIGVSVGSVVGLLLSAGYSPAELADCALGIDLMTQVFAMKPFKRETFMSRSGFFSTTAIEAYLTKLLETKFSKVPTLGELYRLTGMELVVVSTNVTKCEPAYLSRSTKPDLSCIQAVLMSISIPLVFEYRELDGERYVDGALTDPLPVQLYPDEDQLVLRILDNANQSADLLSYVYAAFSVSMEYMVKEKLARLTQSEEFRERCRVIDLVTPNFNPVNPTMSGEEKQNMINQGKKIAIEFIIASELGPNAKSPSDKGRRPTHPGGDVRRRLRPLPQFQAKSAPVAPDGDVGDGH